MEFDEYFVYMKDEYFVYDFMNLLETQVKDISVETEFIGGQNRSLIVWCHPILLVGPTFSPLVDSFFRVPLLAKIGLDVLESAYHKTSTSVNDDLSFQVDFTGKHSIHLDSNAMVSPLETFQVKFNEMSSEEVKDCLLTIILKREKKEFSTHASSRTSLLSFITQHSIHLSVEDTGKGFRKFNNDEVIDSLRLVGPIMPLLSILTDLFQTQSQFVRSIHLPPHIEFYHLRSV